MSGQNKDKNTGLYTDQNNDKYLSDLGTLNRRKNEWSEVHPKYKMYKGLAFLMFGIGCVVIWRMYLLTKNAATSMETLPLHASIWGTALLTILVNKYGKKIYEKPFGSLHSTRLEAAPKGIYYIYQQGMMMVTYYIKDKDLREIIRDDESNCLYFKGKGMLEVQTRKGTAQHSINGIYALIGFDRYDLDDLLEPYGDMVTVAPGTLRKKYLDEGSEQ